MRDASPTTIHHPGPVIFGTPICSILLDPFLRCDGTGRPKNINRHRGRFVWLNGRVGLPTATKTTTVYMYAMLLRPTPGMYHCCLPWCVMMCSLAYLKRDEWGKVYVCVCRCVLEFGKVKQHTRWSRAERWSIGTRSWPPAGLAAVMDRTLRRPSRLYCYVFSNSVTACAASDRVRNVIRIKIGKDVCQRGVREGNEIILTG